MKSSTIEVYEPVIDAVEDRKLCHFCEESRVPSYVKGFGKVERDDVHIRLGFQHGSNGVNKSNSCGTR
jgi:hypothetical protein